MAVHSLDSKFAKLDHFEVMVCSRNERAKMEIHPNKILQELLPYFLMVAGRKGSLMML